MEPNWTPMFNGDIYCSSACGHGCTKVAHDKAVSSANALAAKIGKNWKPRVWENLGWHYSVQLLISPDFHIEIHQSFDGSYWINAYVQDQFHMHHTDPVKGVEEVLRQAQHKGETILSGVDKIKCALSS